MHDKLAPDDSLEHIDPTLPPGTASNGATNADESSAALGDDHDAAALPPEDTGTLATPPPKLAVSVAWPHAQAVRQNARKEPRSVLLTIACLGEVTLDHIRRLEFPDKHDKTRQRAMRALIHHNPPLIQARRRYAHDDVRNIPIPLPEVYALTPMGHERIRMDPQYPLKTRTDQYPAKPTALRVERLLEHDLLATQAIVRLIELARSAGLSGVFVARELRLDPGKPAPIMDALVVLHVNGEPCHADTVPWTKDGQAASEHSWRIAVESDRNTEPISTIQAKARCYRDVCVDPQWHAQWQSRFGPFPVVLWMVLHERRLQAVNRCWHAEWPEGQWLLATEAMIARNVWMYHEPHVEQLATVTMFVPGVAALGVMHHQQVSPTPAPPRLSAVPSNPPVPTPESLDPPAPAPAPPNPRLPAPRAEHAVLEAPPATSPMQSSAPVRRPRVVIRAADLPRSHTLTTSKDRVPDYLGTPVHRVDLPQMIDWGKDLICAALQAPANVRAWWQTRACENVGLLFVMLIIGVVASLFWLWEPLRRGVSREYTYGVQLVASYLPEQRPLDPVSHAVSSAATPEIPLCGRVQVLAIGVRERLEPGLHGQVYRTLAQGEHLLVRCVPHQQVDGLDWTPVAGEHDVLSGWVATRYLASSQH